MDEHRVLVTGLKALARDREAYNVASAPLDHALRLSFVNFGRPARKGRKDQPPFGRRWLFPSASSDEACFQWRGVFDDAASAMALDHLLSFQRCNSFG
jgi:hypothetical protein